MTDTGMLLLGYSEQQPGMKESVILHLEKRSQHLDLGSTGTGTGTGTSTSASGSGSGGSSSGSHGSVSTPCPDDGREDPGALGCTPSEWQATPSQGPASLREVHPGALGCTPSEWQATPSQGPASLREVPRVSELAEMFDALADRQTGAMRLPQLRLAIPHLNARFRLGLGPDDAGRLLGFLLVDSEGIQEVQEVSRQQFVRGVRELASLLQRVSGKITLHQMKVVLAHAFVRFDLDGDNRISVSELATAMHSMGVELGHRDITLLHSFLAPNTTGEIVQGALCEEPFPLEKLGSAARRFCEKFPGAELLVGAGHTLQRAIHAWMSEKDNAKKPQRALDALWYEGEALERAFQTAEFALDVSGMLVAMQYMSDSFGDVLEAHALQHGFNASAVATLVACLGVCGVSTASVLDDLSVKEMSADEALLFAQLFQRHGFGSSEFRQLLSCPSCEWATAEPGEVLNEAGDDRLKILVKGSASVSTEGGQRVTMPPFSSIGETLFLRGRRLWTREVVAAVDRVVYVSWDPIRLKERLRNNDKLDLLASGLLSELMTSNLSTLSRARRCLEGASMDQPSPERAIAEGHAKCAGPKELWPAGSAAQPRPVSGLEFTLCLSHLGRRLGVEVAAGDDEARLLAYLGAADLGVVVDLEEVVEKLRSLEASLAALERAGLTLEELAAVLRRSATTVDSNGDGAICCEEFAAALGRVCQMPEEHAGALFSYYASGKALIPVDSLREAFCSHSLASALQSALHSEAERRGLSRCSYFARQVSQALQGDGSPQARVQRVLDAMFGGAESFAETTRTANDLVGVVSTFPCVWQELAGVASIDDVNDMNLAPFLICLAMCGVHVARRVAESSVTDMEEREALLYSKAFEAHGWSVTEFRKLLKHGGAQWEHYDPGDVVAQGPGQLLRVVAKGSCEVWDTGSGVARERLNPGAVKDQRAAGDSHVLRVTQAATIVAWDWTELESLLDRDQVLKQRLLHTVVSSRADRLLEAYHGHDDGQPPARATAA